MTNKTPNFIEFFENRRKLPNVHSGLLITAQICAKQRTWQTDRSTEQLTLLGACIASHLSYMTGLMLWSIRYSQCFQAIYIYILFVIMHF